MTKKLFAIPVLCYAAVVPASAISALQLAALEKKAFDGDADALYMLGQYYEIGDGVPADKKIAECYYTAAANLGYKAAKIKLGLIVAAPPPPRSAVSAGKAFSADCGNGVKLELLPVPAGAFTMGSPSDEEGRFGNEAQAYVNITKPFWLGKTEITQAQWQAVMGNNPSFFKGDSNLPVECVSWNDAMDFCKKLTAKARAAGTLPANVEFTLPTEAQWEYACRAGTTSRFCFGDEESSLRVFGNYYDKSGDKKYDAEFRQKNNWKLSPDTTYDDGFVETAPVASFRQNAWGFYDMHGNVWEWCLDYYDPTLSGGNDPCRATSGSGEYGSNRVYRGGSWFRPVRNSRSAYRGGNAPGFRVRDVGFRVVAVSRD